jgi:hypothetical protein
LLVLAVLASTMTYAGFHLIGVLADQLGTGRAVAGLLLGGLFARFPRIRQGKLRMVGLLPKPVRRPLIVSLFAVCTLILLSRGDSVPALATGFATTFLLGYPWLRKTLFDRMVSSVFKTFTAGRAPLNTADDRVIDAEFRERKD